MQPPGSASSCKTSFLERTWLGLSTGSRPARWPSSCWPHELTSCGTETRKDADAWGKVAYEPGDQDVADLDMVLRTRTPRMGLWIDTSDLSVEQTTDQILKQLDSQATVRRQ